MGIELITLVLPIKQPKQKYIEVSGKGLKNGMTLATVSFCPIMMATHPQSRQQTPWSDLHPPSLLHAPGSFYSRPYSLIEKVPPRRTELITELRILWVLSGFSRGIFLWQVGTFS